MDDEEALTDLLADLLEEEGYAVDRAYNGEQALVMLRSGDPPDLVLSDVMMPRMSGTELVQEARRAIPPKRLPFLLLSAGVEPRVRLENVRFMAKPLHLDHLLEQVQTLLDARELSLRGGPPLPRPA